VQIDITPVDVDLSLAPGESYDGEFSIINRSTNAIDFRVTANGFYVKNLAYETTFDDDIALNQIVHWVTFDQTDFSNLKPNDRQNVAYHIKVPDDAPGGGQYAVLFATVSSEAVDGSVTIKTDSRVGIKIYAKVAGETRTGGQVKSVEQPRFYTTPPIASVAQVKNTGNVDFHSRHEYVVESLFGGELFKGSAVYRIMPDTTREVRLEWGETSSIGIFKVHNKISFLGETQYDKVSIVVVIPIWLVVILLMILLSLIGLIVFLISRLIKKNRHQKSNS